MLVMVVDVLPVTAAAFCRVLLCVCRYGYSRNPWQPLPGIGVGVPMSRVYAAFMGGSIEWETDSWRRHTTVDFRAAQARLHLLTAPCCAGGWLQFSDSALPAAVSAPGTASPVRVWLWWGTWRCVWMSGLAHV